MWKKGRRVVALEKGPAVVVLEQCGGGLGIPVQAAGKIEEKKMEMGGKTTALNCWDKKKKDRYGDGVGGQRRKECKGS